MFKRLAIFFLFSAIDFFAKAEVEEPSDNVDFGHALDDFDSADFDQIWNEIKNDPVQLEEFQKAYTEMVESFKNDPAGMNEFLDEIKENPKLAEMINSIDLELPFEEDSYDKKSPEIDSSDSGVDSPKDIKTLNSPSVDSLEGKGVGLSDWKATLLNEKVKDADRKKAFGLFYNYFMEIYSSFQASLDKAILPESRFVFYLRPSIRDKAVEFVGQFLIQVRNLFISLHENFGPEIFKAMAKKDQQALFEALIKLYEKLILLQESLSVLGSEGAKASDVIALEKLKKLEVKFLRSKDASLALLENLVDDVLEVSSTVLSDKFKDDYKKKYGKVLDGVKKSTYRAPAPYKPSYSSGKTSGAGRSKYDDYDSLGDYYGADPYGDYGANYDDYYSSSPYDSYNGRNFDFGPENSPELEKNRADKDFKKPKDDDIDYSFNQDGLDLFLELYRFADKKPNFSKMDIQDLYNSAGALLAKIEANVKSRTGLDAFLLKLSTVPKKDLIDQADGLPVLSISQDGSKKEKAQEGTKKSDFIALAKTYFKYIPMASVGLGKLIFMAKTESPFSPGRVFHRPGVFLKSASQEDGSDGLKNPSKYLRKAWEIPVSQSADDQVSFEKLLSDGPTRDKIDPVQALSDFLAQLKSVQEETKKLREDLQKIQETFLKYFKDVCTIDAGVFELENDLNQYSDLLCKAIERAKLDFSSGLGSKEFLIKNIFNSSDAKGILDLSANALFKLAFINDLALNHKVELPFPGAIRIERYAEDLLGLVRELVNKLINCVTTFEIEVFSQEDDDSEDGQSDKDRIKNPSVQKKQWAIKEFLSENDKEAFTARLVTFLAACAGVEPSGLIFSKFGISDSALTKDMALFAKAGYILAAAIDLVDKANLLWIDSSGKQLQFRNQASDRFKKALWALENPSRSTEAQTSSKSGAWAIAGEYASSVGRFLQNALSKAWSWFSSIVGR